MVRDQNAARSGTFFKHSPDRVAQSPRKIHAHRTHLPSSRGAYNRADRQPGQISSEINRCGQYRHRTVGMFRADIVLRRNPEIKPAATQFRSPKKRRKVASARSVKVAGAKPRDR